MKETTPGAGRDWPPSRQGLSMATMRGAFRIVKHVGRQVTRHLAKQRVTRARIAADLAALGVAQGGIVLVHSSLSSLGYVKGGAVGVLEALRDVIGPNGTLVLPTHSWEAMEAGCRVFDVALTPSCTGFLPEVFRRMPGVLRSLHPTHSVAALGPAARWLIDRHERAETPCGPETPYAKALARNCQVVFIGTGLESNTVFHTVEAAVRVPYLLYDVSDTFTLVDAMGERHTATIRRHRARVRCRFASLEAEFIEEGLLKVGRVGAARASLLFGGLFEAWMRKVLARDPYYLLTSRHEIDRLFPLERMMHSAGTFVATGPQEP